MIERYISHKQDIRDLMTELSDKVLPLRVWYDKAVPEKTDTHEYAKRSRLMSYFHRTICVEYAIAAGVNEQEAKYELLSKLGRCEEIVVTEEGEYDVVWLESDKLRVFEEGKKLKVQSVAGMNNNELSALINNCKDYLLQYYGIMVTDFKRKYKTK